MAKSFLFLAAISVNSNKSDAPRKWIVGFFSDQVPTFFLDTLYDSSSVKSLRAHPLSNVG